MPPSPPLPPLIFIFVAGASPVALPFATNYEWICNTRVSRWTQWILSSGLVSNGTSQQKHYDYLTWIPRNCFSSKSSWKIVPELEMQSRSWFALGVPFPKMYGRIRISEMIFTTYGGTKFFSYLIHEGLSHLCNLRSESSDLCREKYKKFKH